MLDGKVKTVNVCYCGRHLTEVEIYFYNWKCTECRYQEIQAMIRRDDEDGNRIRSRTS